MSNHFRDSRYLVLFKNYAGFYEILSLIVIVTLHMLSHVFSTIAQTCAAFRLLPLCCLAVCLLVTLFSFQGATLQLLPEVRSKHSISYQMLRFDLKFGGD